MPDQYIDAPIEFDEIALYNAGIARIQEYFPNWQPRPASFFDISYRSIASMMAVAAEVASDVPFSIFQAFGPLAHVPPINATPATAQSVWTMIDDTGGYLIPDATPVGLTLSTAGVSEPVGFETVGDAVVPAGQQTISITLVATNPGADTSGLDTVVRADSLAFVSSVILVGISQGGVDAEPPDDYTNRLSQDFETWSTTPLRGRDFAIKAREIASVYRCGYIENFNPADGTTDNDKYVTLCPVDISGLAVSATVQAQVSDYMEAIREVNFVCPVVGPSYSTVAITAQLHTSTVAEQDTAIANATEALQSLLSPASWGMPSSGEVPVWENTSILRYNKVITVLESLPGVDYADQVTIGIEGGSMAAVDLALPGAFPLPQAGTLTITAVTP